MANVRCEADVNGQNEIPFICDDLWLIKFSILCQSGKLPHWIFLKKCSK